MPFPGHKGVCVGTFDLPELKRVHQLMKEDKPTCLHQEDDNSPFTCDLPGQKCGLGLHRASCATPGAQCGCFGMSNGFWGAVGNATNASCSCAGDRHKILLGGRWMCASPNDDQESIETAIKELGEGAAAKVNEKIAQLRKHSILMHAVFQVHHSQLKTNEFDPTFPNGEPPKGGFDPQVGRIITDLRKNSSCGPSQMGNILNTRCVDQPDKQLLDAIEKFDKKTEVREAVEKLVEDHRSSLEKFATPFFMAEHATTNDGQQKYDETDGSCMLLGCSQTRSLNVQCISSQCYCGPLETLDRGPDGEKDESSCVLRGGPTPETNLFTRYKHSFFDELGFINYEWDVVYCDAGQIWQRYTKKCVQSPTEWIDYTNA